jgi:drug/metabolite transporter (DMT)-like permease
MRPGRILNLRPLFSKYTVSMQVSETELPRATSRAAQFSLAALFAGAIAIAFALAHLPASFSSVTLLVQPVMATVFPWLILSETITPLQGIGGVLVLGGIFVARRAFT